jgi:hypothetical protein
MSPPAYSSKTLVDCTDNRRLSKQCSSARELGRRFVHPGFNGILLCFAICSPTILQRFVLRKTGQTNSFRRRVAQECVKELADESEVLHVRKELDGEILPAKVIPEHADDGRAYCKTVERGLGNYDGNFPFWKQPRTPTFCETRYHHSFVS